MSLRSALLLGLLILAGCGHPPAMPESLRNDPPPAAPSEETGPVGSEDVDEKDSPSTVAETTTTESDQGEPVANIPDGSVVINEIYYDAIGSDTDGLLFVELFGTAEMEIGEFRIVFVNGDNGVATDSITLPQGARIGADSFYLVTDSRDGQTGVTQVPGADLIDNFDPQNGPDAVQLLDPAGDLADAVAYGEVAVAIAENGLPLVEGAAAPDVASGHSLERAEAGGDTDNNSADFIEREIPTPGS